MRATAFLARRWFVLTILTGIVAACFVPGSLHWTRHIDAQIVMALALFLSSWTLESRSLYRALVRPMPAIWAAVISFGFLPALGWMSGQLLPIADFRIGLMICTSVPCTLASAVLWTRMAGGAEATALLSTFLTTSLSWAATTLWLTVTTGSQVEIDVGAMMTNLAIVLVLPVGVGQLARMPASLRWAAIRGKAPLGVLSRLLILVIMLRAAVDVSEQLHRETAPNLSAFLILGTAGLCIAIHLTALFGGVWSSRLLGFDHATQIAVGFAGSQKTLPVSLLLFERYFSGYALAVVPLLFYHSGQLIVDTFIAEWWLGKGRGGSGSRGQAE